MHRRSRVAAFTLAGSAAVVALAGVTVGAQTTDGDGSTTTLVAPTPTLEVPTTTTGVVDAQNPFPGADLTFAAFLSSGQEVPPTVSSAAGEVRFSLAGDGTEITWEGRFAGLSEAAAGHLHWAPVGENGPVVVPLFESIVAVGPFLSVEGTITADDLTGPLEGLTLDALVAQIASGQIYANVHTSDGVEDELEPGDYPDGEIRGQVLVWTVTSPDTGGTTTTTVGDTTSTTGDTTSTTGDATTTTLGDTTSTTGDTTSTTADTTSTTVDDSTSTTMGDTTSTSMTDDTTVTPIEDTPTTIEG